MHLSHVRQDITILLLVNPLSMLVLLVPMDIIPQERQQHAPFALLDLNVVARHHQLCALMACILQVAQVLALHAQVDHIALVVCLHYAVQAVTPAPLVRVLVLHAVQVTMLSLLAPLNALCVLEGLNAPPPLLLLLHVLRGHMQTTLHRQCVPRVQQGLSVPTVPML